MGLILIIYFLAGGGAETITMYSHQEHQVRNFPFSERPAIFSTYCFRLVHRYLFALWMLHNLDRIEKQKQKINIQIIPSRPNFFVEFGIAPANLDAYVLPDKSAFLRFKELIDFAIGFCILTWLIDSGTLLFLDYWFADFPPNWIFPRCRASKSSNLRNIDLMIFIELSAARVHHKIIHAIMNTILLM